MNQAFGGTPNVGNLHTVYCIYCISVYCSLLILWTCVKTLGGPFLLITGITQQQLKVQWFLWSRTDQEPRTMWYDMLICNIIIINTVFHFLWSRSQKAKGSCWQWWPQQNWAEPLRVATLGYIGYIAWKPIHLDRILHAFLSSKSFSKRQAQKQICM